MLSDDTIARFMADGFLHVPGAVPPEVIEPARDDIDAALRAEGIDPDDPSTWPGPAQRVPTPLTRPLALAGMSPDLWATYDQLLGEGTWHRTPGVGSTLAVRFPHADDPGDAGWHIDGSFEIDGLFGANVRSRGRGLLVLFLLTGVGPDDAPTELKVGSHHDVPPVLAPFGDAGATYLTIAQPLPDAVFDRPSAFATGQAGDAYICHPFLVHRATWPHRGTHPRVIAQPGVTLIDPFALDPTTAGPVETTIIEALAR